jgi:hypothetical protein
MRWLICLGVVLVGCGVVKAPSEAGGLKGITILNTAEVEYFSDHGRFATSLQELGPSGANLIERDLASGEKDGYRFTMTATPSGYAISAVPVQSDVSGTKSYFLDGRSTDRDLDLDQPVITLRRRVPLSSGRCPYLASALRHIPLRLS